MTILLKAYVNHKFMVDLSSLLEKSDLQRNMYIINVFEVRRFSAQQNIVHSIKGWIMNIYLSEVTRWISFNRNHLLLIITTQRLNNTCNVYFHRAWMFKENIKPGYRIPKHVLLIVFTSGASLPTLNAMQQISSARKHCFTNSQF